MPNENNLQDIADFALGEFKKNFPLRQYENIEVSSATRMIGARMSRKGEQRNTSEIMDSIIKPMCAYLACECVKRKVIGFAKPTSPAHTDAEIAFATDKSGVFIRLAREYDENSMSFDVSRDVFIYGLDVVVLEESPSPMEYDSKNDAFFVKESV